MLSTTQPLKVIIITCYVELDEELSNIFKNERIPDGRLSSRAIKYIRDNYSRIYVGEADREVYEDVKTGSIFEIVTLQKDKYWMIDEYDGSEFIRYLDIDIDSATKYCKIKNKLI